MQNASFIKPSVNIGFKVGYDCSDMEGHKDKAQLEFLNI